ncbi:mismatch repair ATPase [Saccharomycopsis crataegensis]|uniref:DNA mismatch repair protein n=1 Tax=Saccharomycopsis crataegensis TaxID=43959 RepID=A0AAV5QLQ1_9ASCO|nr:mismatch repair ATPase [Saccharomycopsis crataegensis]
MSEIAATTPVKPKTNNKKAFTDSSDKRKQASIFNFFAKKKPANKSSTTSASAAVASPPNSSTKNLDAKNTADTSLSSTIGKKNVTKQPQPSLKKESIVAKSINGIEELESHLETPVSSSQEKSDDDQEGLASSPLSRNHPTARRKVNYSELSDDDEEEEEINFRSKKRKQAKVVDSDSEDEFVPSGGEDNDFDDDLEVESASITAVDELNGGDIVMDEDDEAMVLDELLDEHDKKSRSASEDENDTFVAEDGPKRVSTKSQSQKPKLADKFRASSNYSASKPAPRQPTKSKSPEKSFKKQNEERYQWLVTIRDAERRLESDPEYDQRTLYIPSKAWEKFTPFETQYWTIKSKMWDSVVFFKKGKFYELYEKDALLGHSLFDLKLAGTGRANMQLAGIPEMSFDYWASEFISKGFKVAKVDQKETLLAKQMNDRVSGKKETKIIERKLSCVLTGGTLTQEGMLNNEMATYCMAVKQNTNTDGSNIFGVAIIDTAVGAIRLLEFNDDSECTNLETFVNQIKPKEVVVEKSNLTSLAQKIIKFNCATNSLWNSLKPETEFWDEDITLEELCKGKYFEAKDLDDRSHWPKILVEYSENKPIGFSAFGGLLWYLKSLNLDRELISIGNIEKYDIYKSISTLILDGQTLQNLEVFTNQFDGSDKGTLFKLINRAITPFGKRMLKSWVCHPLLKVDAINERLDAVDGLLNDGNLLEILSSRLRSLPDLERLLSRIHAGNLKVKDFAKVIESFNNIKKLNLELVGEYGSIDTLPGVLSKFFQSIPSELNSAIEEWENSFDHSKAITEDLLIPEPGVEKEFDESNSIQQDMEKQLNTLLRQYKREYKSQEICFKDSGKEIYLIEVPNKALKKIPKDWVIMGSTSKNKRYWSPEVKEIVQELMEARERHKSIVENLKSKLYARFDKNYLLWMNTVKAIANVDSIISLALTSESLGQPSCRPSFIDSTRGQVNFEELRHPCFVGGGVSGTKEFIPNDVQLGGENARLGLLTGANAAGKSTVLRMTCIAVILAQLGCYVPATSATLTPIDRIMTRLGANDNLIQGKSTFFVELSETKRILESATPRSLLVLDELGRGGSSSDGYAIAEAVLYHIATHIQSIGFFATHYGSLGIPFRSHPAVRALRMAILANENSRNVTFLYKLEDGAAAGSFGMNVASMCGIQSEIIDKAEIAANELEHTSRMKKNNELANLSESGIPLGLQSDIAWLIRGGLSNNSGCIGEGSRIYDGPVKETVLQNILSMVDGL